MRKLFCTLLAMVCFAGWSQAQVVYENFESGATLPWTAGNGSYDGVAENPDKTGINPSDSVGVYTKSDSHSFSLFIAQLPSPMDLSVNNEFHLMINAPVDTRVLLKLEGPSGAIEATKNIAVINAWVDYTFDFSGAAGLTDLDKIIIFFDPGVTSSGDTYLFDNVRAEPEGPCAGTVADPTIIDDFECQRNASYASGYNRIEAIPNPDQSGINTSASVGEYTDPIDQWSALVVDYNSPIDLSTRHLIKAKVWSPKTGQILFKLEGGVSPAAEIFVDVTTTNQWVEYEANFSAQAAAQHEKIAIFFNDGVLADSGDVYYIDDIQRVEAPSGEIFEDFEPTKLTWEPLNNNSAVHGNFSVITNPDQSGANTSANVGEYTKGSSNFSTLTAFVPGGIDLSTFAQVNIQVWPPAGATEMTMQLNSPTQGNKEKTASFSGTQAWETVSFDFSEFNNITDFDAVQILFDAGAAVSGTYYFDNLGIGSSTVDPCEGVIPEPNIVDNFECQRNATYTAGEDRLEVINNPDPTSVNNSTLVGEYTDVLDQFSALVVDYGASIDLSTFNQFKMKIWAPVTGQMLFKLEGGTSPAVEIFVDVTTTSEWIEYTADFSDQAEEDHTKLAIFFNAGVTPAQEDIYYIDDLRWSRSPFTGCILNFDNPIFSYKDWGYFANGAGDDTEFMVIENPDKTGVNTSDSVGVFEEFPDGETFAGMFTRDLGAPISLPNDNKTIRMKVWSPDATQMVMKLEQGRDGTPASGDIIADYTDAGMWQELTFDFSGPIADDALHNRLTLILGFGETPATQRTIYFDDIIIADATCATQTSNEQPQLQAFRAYPNPASTQLHLDNLQELSQLRLFNLMGQELRRLDLNRKQNLTLDITELNAGIYILTGYDRDGRSISKKFVKE